jgi:hypothetical protein
MATRSIAPLNGAVVLGGYVADFNAFRVRIAQGVEGVTPFGANTCSKNVGAGTPDFSFTISAALLCGTVPAKPVLTDGTGIWKPSGVGNTANDGTSSVFTLGTGVSLSCDCVLADFDTGAARMRAAEPVALSGKNYGDVIEAWATT